MFLHSGAGLHGHEYSNKRSNSEPSVRRQTLLRSSMRRPRIEEARRFSSPVGDSPPPQSEDDSLSDKLRPYSLPPSTRSVSESLRSKEQSVRFSDDPKNHTPSPLQSEDEESLAGSDITASSDVSSRRKRRHRQPRKSAKFALAHPAPQLRTKQRRLVQFRPKLLLQLQELGERRAIPAFDVVPSSHVAGTLIIPVLAKRFPRMFRSKPDLGHDDLLLMRSEDYNIPSPASSQTSSDDTSDEMGQRDALAVVTTKPHQHDKAEIITSDGSTWAVNTISNGSYEVTKQSGENPPVTGRWVRRITPVRANSSSSEVPNQATGQRTEYRWTFSILDPAARRHPVMGVLTSTSLEVYDNFTTMSSSSSRYPPTKSFGNATAASELPSTPAPKEERSTVPVQEEHKVLMMASGVWISLRQEGWPATANPKFSRAFSAVRHSISDGPRRSVTFTDSREGASDARKKLEADTRRRSKSASAAAQSTGSVNRSASVKTPSTDRTPDDDNDEQKQSNEEERGARNPVARLGHWLKKCFH